MFVIEGFDALFDSKLSICNGRRRGKVVMNKQRCREKNCKGTLKWSLGDRQSCFDRVGRLRRRTRWSPQSHRSDRFIYSRYDERECESNQQSLQPHRWTMSLSVQALIKGDRKFERCRDTRDIEILTRKSTQSACAAEVLIAATVLHVPSPAV